MRKTIFLSIAVVTLLGTLTSNATSQPRLAIPNQKITQKEAQEIMNTTLEMKDFQLPMKLSEFIGLMITNVKAKGKKFPIYLDDRSFKVANPNDPSVWDTYIKMPYGVKKATVQNLVESACAQVPTGNAVFKFSNGFLVITTGNPARNAKVGKGVLVDTTQQLTAGEAMKFLNSTIELRNFQIPMKITECLGLCTEIAFTQNKKFPVFLDTMSFNKAFPNKIPVQDAVVKFPADKKTVKMYDFLQLICSQLPGKKAQFQYNNGYFYIIPGK